MLSQLTSKIEIMKAGRTFISYLYGAKKYFTVNDLRYHIYIYYEKRTVSKLKTISGHKTLAVTGNPNHTAGN